MFVGGVIQGPKRGYGETLFIYNDEEPFLDENDGMGEVLYINR